MSDAPTADLSERDRDRDGKWLYCEGCANAVKLFGPDHAETQAVCGQCGGRMYGPNA